MLLEAKTRVRPEKQKLIGLTLAGGKGKQPAPDGAELAALNLAGKRPFRFILMGTPEVTGSVCVLCCVGSERVGPRVFVSQPIDRVRDDNVTGGGVRGPERAGRPARGIKDDRREVE